MRRAAPITEAEMNRALKVARKANAREVVIETPGASIRIVLGENSGDNQKAKVEKRKWSLL
jgi:hypothetical protein